MNLNTFLLTILSCFLLNFNAEAKGLADKGLNDQSTVKFATAEQAVELLLQEDDFTKSWSQFDIDSRVGKTGSTKEQLFALIAEQARDFSAEEQAKIETAWAEIEERIEDQGFRINFPEEIYFVKTTGAEEGGAVAYTRKNYIVLSEGFFQQPKESILEVTIHELFHLLSRADSKFREEMYQIIGFKLMNEIAYPESMAHLRITNPDAPQTDSYITLNFEEQPTECMMVLYASKEYSGGSFFTYLRIGFLVLEGDAVKQPKLTDGKPQVYSFQEATDFFKQVGQNTQYIIHPEEIMADNFAYAIQGKEGQKDQWLIEAIAKKLKE